MSKTYTIDEIKAIASDIAKEYGVEKIALFGSYARGEQKSSSDIDFIIKKGNIKGYIQFYSFVSTLEEKLGTNVDVLTYNALENSLIGNSIGSVK